MPLLYTLTSTVAHITKSFTRTATPTYISGRAKKCVYLTFYITHHIQSHAQNPILIRNAHGQMWDELWTVYISMNDRTRSCLQNVDTFDMIVAFVTIYIYKTIVKVKL